MKFLKCFNRFFIFLFAVMFVAITSFPTYVKADNTQRRLVGWQDKSGNNAVISVTVSQYDPDTQHTTISTLFPKDSASSTNAINIEPNQNLSLEIRLKDGYRFSSSVELDGKILFLGGVQSGTDNLSNSSSAEKIKVPGDSWTQDTDFYLYFYTQFAGNVLNNVELNVTPPQCGLEVDGNGDPGPTVTCPENAKYTLLSAYWFEGDGDHYIHAFTALGGEKYGFGTIIIPKTGYTFNDYRNVYVTINDGKRTYSGYNFSGFRASEYVGGDNDGMAVEACGSVTAVHVPVETKQNVIDPTCTESGSYESITNCQSCGQEIGRGTVTTDATGHDWGEWKITKEPTETEKGEKTRICKNDPSHVQTKKIPELEPEPEETYYTVTFDNKGLGTAPKSQILSEGETAIEPERLYATGYSFGGWYIDEDCTEPFDFDTPITSDITLYAKWIPLATGIIQTGDNSNLTFHSQMMIISLMGFILICYPKSRKKASLPK